MAGSGSPAAVHPHWLRHTVLFLSGQTVSLLGSSLVQYAILWHLTLETKSGVVLTLATAFGFLPQAVMSVFGGVWADRHNRKLLLIASDATIAAATLILAVLLLRGEDGLWLIYAALAVRSLGAGVQMPAVGALLPQIVPVEHLMRVNGINTSIQSALTLLAPALAAALYAALGLQSVLLVDVSTAVVGICLVAVIPVATLRRADAAAGYFDDLRAGLGYIRRHDVILRVLILFAIVFVLAAPPGYLTPLMVVRTFGEEIWKLTVNELAFGIGMLGGGALIAIRGGGRDRMRLLVIACLAFAVCSIGMGLSGDILGHSGSFAVYLAFMLAIGLAVAYFSTATMTLFQEQVEPTMLGRVFGVNGIIMAVAMPIGMLMFGPLADVISIEWILVLTGVLMLVATLVVGHRAPEVLAPAPAATTEGP